ncbi:SigE family RNA polymerase sigma factor [Nocardioides speluncae]|uniref:SigE family RNA polymerase sigma factor n=1 Tax=Nocardioides speluncae TaxID=2670337 RepID=UPI001F0CB60E|nr:SigE family RNA polymerase sigma factor [Nocardioides speluncae]
MSKHESFEQFAVETTPMLYRTAWLLVGEQQAAEDLVQETFARLFPRWERGSRLDNPAGYARTVLVHQFIKGKQRRSSTEVPTEVLPEQAVEPDVAASLALHAAIVGLPRTDRAIIVLRYYGDRTVAEVGHDLGLSDSAVRSRASRAIAKLRDQLGADLLIPSL